MLGEPCEARPEVGAAAALNRAPLRQVAVGMNGRVLNGGIDLEKRDGLRLQFRRNLPHLRPEQGQVSVGSELEVSTMTATATMTAMV